MRIGDTYLRETVPLSIPHIRGEFNGTAQVGVVTCEVIVREDAYGRDHAREVGLDGRARAIMDRVTMVPCGVRTVAACIRHVSDLRDTAPAKISAGVYPVINPEVAILMVERNPPIVDACLGVI